VDSINGLNENDFNARWLDNAVPGFKSSDPLAERHPDESPYLYCGNNPVNRVDPTGLQWYTKEGGSKTDFFFFKDKSINPYISGGVRYNLAGETVSAYVGDDGKFTYFKNGDKFGNVTDEKCVNVASPTVTGINLSLASGGGTYNNTAPNRISGNNQSNDNFNHTISDQFKAINTKYLSVTFNSDVMTKNDPSNKTTVTTNKRLKPISTTTGTLTVGEDGSITVGSTVFGGLNVTTGDYIFGINVPTGLNTSGGITTTANGALIRGIGVVAVGVGIICLGPEVGIALAY